MPDVADKHRPQRRKRMDGRTWEARLLSRVRRELAAHVGGSPSVTERAMIDRVAMLSLHLAQLDRRLTEDRAEADPQAHAALATSLSVLLSRLGRTGAAQAVPA